MQEALTAELERRCGNPECGMTLEGDIRQKYCTPKCRDRAQYLRRGGKEFVYARSIEALYGMTVEEYRSRLQEQDGRCAICGDVPEEGKRLNIDHDHASGAVRELLCRWCNYALGNAKDDPARLRAMAAYLDRHQGS
ncbi:endonuclease VII domain-containing protein [Streptomyces sp. NBC_01422]|uniref:endonuclease VII domain-containing protein n=1 Tax=Streptomyces sp. NBC_01422 TaxID=2903859 RepID=UPI002E2DCDE6|nr:endonuclease VII domain-containing protein [Streptomyces sp. NBC_01422]